MHSARFAFAFLSAAALFGQTAGKRLEFEVASVKPSPPPTTEQFNVGVHIDGAMVRFNFLTLRNYLMMAYDVKDFQIAGPDWLSSDHFDIVAKRPEGITGDGTLREMVKSLLEDRFKIAMHKETRDLPTYALVVGKNGLKIKEEPPEEGADNTKVDVEVSGGGRGGTVVNLGGGASLSYGLNKVEAKKVTFASIMDSLSKFLDRPVVDATNLTGRYSFTLEYTVQELKNLVRASGADPSHIPDFGGDTQVSIFNSVETLGLKLDPRKTPTPVIVIDHAERVPTAN